MSQTIDISSMDEFLKRLDTIDVPNNYLERFLDVMNSFGDPSIGDFDVIEHTTALTKIIAYHWVMQNNSTLKSTGKTNRTLTNKVKATIPYNGTTLTKNQLGYRNSLDNLPSTLRRYLFAYIFVLVG